MRQIPKLFVSFFSLFAILVGQNISCVRASSHPKIWSQKVTKDTFRPKKLFVFGDSYADTGNSGYAAASWNSTYGMTNPGQPTGRNSDGWLLTDYVAEYYGLRTPTAYRFVNPSVPQMLQYGVNFAYTGTGAFDTGINNNPNMTTQIGFLKVYLDQKVLNMTDSLSLLSLNGNDYATRLLSHSTIDVAFIKSVVNQIKRDMRRLCDLGAKAIAVTAMPPSGCIPMFAESPTKCNDTVTAVALIHNVYLNYAVIQLNALRKCSNRILDLHSAFETVFKSETFLNPYQACCVGVNSNYSCGGVDAHGQPMYTVLRDPTSAFYWDTVHPTQAAWNATYEVYLKDALKHSF